MVNPTQQELATLAVALPSGSSSERVNTAYEIWCDVSTKIDELNETDDEKYHRERDELMDYDEECDPIPFGQFLRKLMPKQSIEFRIQKWKKFLMHQFCNSKEAVEATMGRNEADGIDNVENQKQAFLAWTAINAKKSRIARAKKGANGKLLKEDEKKLKKYLEE